MRKVHRQLQRRRRERRRRQRIRQMLWAAAGELAREYGDNRVSWALRLEFNQAEARGGSRRSEGQETSYAGICETDRANRGGIP